MQAIPFVRGALERDDGEVVWRPSEGLEPGQTYSARLRAPAEVQTMWEVSVSADAHDTIAAEDLDFDVELVVVERLRGGSMVCCDGCGDPRFGSPQFRAIRSGPRPLLVDRAMNLSKHLRRILLTGVSVAVLPLGVASAAGATAAPTKAANARPSASTQPKAKAKRLCTQLKSSAPFKKEVARVGKTEAATAEAGRIADDLCRFYAASPSGKKKSWNATLDALVNAELLTARDRKVLKNALRRPRATMATWKPSTAFGRELLERYTQTTEDEPKSEASTAGDVGTILGGMLGGLGGTPMSVGIGAAIGKVAGEAANALGNYWYELAPDGDEGGGEGGDGDGGGDGSGGDGK
jgi:hypothetical protein